MKQTIFLVEDLNNGKPVTLYEILYKDILEKNIKENKNTPWLRHTINLLLSKASNKIRFETLDNFKCQVENNLINIDDYEVYYFIVPIHSFYSFSIFNLLSLKLENLNFLVNHNVKIIVDSCMEKSNLSDIIRLCYDTSAGSYLRGIENLEILITVFSYGDELERLNNYIKNSKFPNIKLIFCPMPFYWIFTDHKSNVFIEEFKKIINNLEQKKITNVTKDWVAKSLKPRFNRVLFFANIFNRNLDQYGCFGINKPLSDAYKKYIETFHLHQNALAPVNEDILEKLNTIVRLDMNNSDHFTDQFDKEFINIPLNPINNLDATFCIVLEFCEPRNNSEIQNTMTDITEKLSWPILQGLPFITFAGKDYKKILAFLGFEPYYNIPFPEDPNFFNQLSTVLDFIETFSKLSLKEKNNLLDLWRPTIIKNFTTFINTDPAEIYIRCLKEDYKNF